MGPLGAAIWLSRLGFTQSEFMANPFPIYQEWLAERPIWEVEPGQWLLFRYEDVRVALTSAAFTKGEAWTQTPPEGYRHLPDLTPSLLMSDPPVHTRLRGLVTQAFQPRHLKRLEPFIVEVARQFSDRVVADGEGELVSQFAFPLPAVVIAELLGVPRADHPQFRAWSKQIVRLLDPSQSPEARQNAMEARWQLLDYFHHLIAEKRRAPADDLLTELVQVEADGDRLAPGELLAMALLLLVAGHETTTNLIPMGTLALIPHPHPRPEDDWHDPVEELLRYTSPVQLDARLVAESISLGTVTIPGGSWVTLVLGAANRDPSIFPDPDTLNLSRHPNPHLAFGRGIHFCLGAALARMEALIAFPTLWQYEWRLAGEPLWNENIVLRGLTALPVRLG
ncbi:MAG: cytochrome P450 [Sulfobacillus acidophilus]|uniref:Cytochrome P450 n=1 Tax=Sulfobacillus acidophilus TaxID=53633 RepID=A0A2T2WM03_9FIRM|nr:MAG: cytochrome P450 [Sulfobacillus acidophilus]